MISRSSFLGFTVVNCLTAWIAHAQQTPAVKLTLTTPADYQVYQRATAKTGKIIVSGKLEVAPGSAAPQTLQARITGEGADGQWQRVAFDPHAPAFQAEVSAPAGGWYRLELEASSQGKTIAETATDHVGVGEVFIIAGQSNSANHGEEKLTTQSNKFVAFRDGAWQLANDPQPGASGTGGSFLPAFGDAMVDRFKVPVGIVATGVGGSSVREWMPQDVPFANPPTNIGNVVKGADGTYTSRGGIYINLINRMLQQGPTGFRAVLWHQGESDANQADPSRTLPGSAYQTLLETLIARAQKDSKIKAPWFVAQVSYHGPTDVASEDIRQAQRKTWSSGAALEGPDSDALIGDTRERNGQGIHFSGKGLREHARLWVEKVAPWLEAQLKADR